MTRVRRSRTKGSAKAIGKSLKTRRYAKDVDQVHEELARQASGLSRTRQTDTTVPELEADELPGLGEFMCVECSRHFISTEALATHVKSKVHKRRLKELKDGPYSQAEAEAAAGLGKDTRRMDASGNLVKPGVQKDEVMATAL